MKKNWSLTVALFLMMMGVAKPAALAGPVSLTDTGQQQRKYLVQTLSKIADPVLNALSQNKLKALMPVEAKIEGRKNYTYLEAFGRLLAGMAPWLELGPDKTEEGLLRKKYIELARKGIHNATDPEGPDFMNFNKGGQPLVDAAFFAQALLRAPGQLWEPLDEKTRANVISALKSSRAIIPSYSNWLMFSATIEAALLKFDNSGDRMRIDYALKSHMLWYKGDGAYGDGPNFHWDYYNSFVIQPMLVDVCAVLSGRKSIDKRTFDLVNNRANRYAEVQERLISPEGTYPPIGRSLAYRFGAFQSLAQAVLQKNLPKELLPQQVRAALYTLIRKQVAAAGTFDEAGWLRIGLYGYQPGIGEEYISTGSLYLCSQAFLILGLPADDPFWKGPDADWTAKKIWKGLDITTDHARE